jgi:murein DD-endopeptidase MepM/ murein hydrolase activator NlpD
MRPRALVLVRILMTLLAVGLIEMPALAAPPYLHTFWGAGDWWQPSTYQGHEAYNGVKDQTKAIDFNYGTGSADLGREILAAHGGWITWAGCQIDRNKPGNPQNCSIGYGKYVTIQSTDDTQYETLYAHLQDIRSDLHVGSWVNFGDLIGWCGQTGNATAPHLHFELLRNKVPQRVDNLTFDGQSVSIDYSRQTGDGRWVGPAIQARPWAVYLGHWMYNYPRDYTGPVWIKLSPRLDNAYVDHLFVVDWGPWENGVYIQFNGSDHADMVFTKRNPDQVPLTVTVNPECNVSFGTGQPPDSDTLDFNNGWWQP